MKIYQILFLMCLKQVYTYVIMADSTWKKFLEDPRCILFVTLMLFSLYKLFDYEKNAERYYAYHSRTKFYLFEASKFLLYSTILVYGRYIFQDTVQSFSKAKH